MFKLKCLCLVLLSVLIYNGCGQDMLRANQSAVHSTATQVGELDLGDEHTTQFKASSEASVVPLYYNRHVTYNLLRDLFGPSLQTELIRDIAWVSEDFGSAFGLYQNIHLSQSDCNNKSNPFYKCRNGSMDMSTKPVIGVSSPREARRMSACQKGVDQDASLAHAFKRIQSSATLANPPKAELKNYQRLYQLFFRGRPLPKENLFDSFDLVVQNEADPRLAWEKLILSVCMSPHWQVM